MASAVTMANMPPDPAWDWYMATEEAPHSRPTSRGKVRSDEYRHSHTLATIRGRTRSRLLVEGSRYHVSAPTSTTVTWARLSGKSPAATTTM